MFYCCFWVIITDSYQVNTWAWLLEFYGFYRKLLGLFFLTQDSSQAADGFLSVLEIQAFTEGVAKKTRELPGVPCIVYLYLILSITKKIVNSHFPPRK